MPNDWMAYIPQQWVGLVALSLFAVTVIVQLVEKYPAFAKLLPLGEWWHDRQKKRRRRADWVAEDNEVIAGFQEQMRAQEQRMAALGAQIKTVENDLRCFRAWSAYDARWHHQDAIEAAEQGRNRNRHYDFFEFEALWNTDPAAAIRLC